MRPQSIPPVLLFIAPLIAVLLLSYQVSALRRGPSDLRRSRRTDRAAPLLFIVSLTSLAILSGSLGLVASETGRADSNGQSSHISVAYQISVTFIKFELGFAVLYLLDQRALVEASMKPTATFTFTRIKLFNIILAHILFGTAILTVVFIVLMETYPTARIADILWLTFVCPSLCLTTVLYFRCRGSGRVAHLWLSLTVGLISGLVSTLLASVATDRTLIPESAVIVVWIICTMLAFQIYSFLPSNEPSPYFPRSTPTPTPIALRARNRMRTPRTSRLSEDFRSLHDPFAPPPLSAGLPPFPFYAANREKDIQAKRRRRRTIARSPTTVRRETDVDMGYRFGSGSAGDLILSQMLLRVLEDGTLPRPPPPAQVMR